MMLGELSSRSLLTRLDRTWVDKTVENRLLITKSKSAIIDSMTAQVEADRGSDLRMNLHTPKLLADDKKCAILVCGLSRHGARRQIARQYRAWANLLETPGDGTFKTRVLSR